MAVVRPEWLHDLPAEYNDITVEFLVERVAKGRDSVDSARAKVGLGPYTAENKTT